MHAIITYKIKWINPYNHNITYYDHIPNNWRILQVNEYGRRKLLLTMMDHYNEFEF